MNGDFETETTGSGGREARSSANRQSRSPLEPGVRVGNYRIRDVIARGGFGVVCSADHVELGTPAAIKLLHDHLTSSNDAVQRFEREIEVIQRVRHPNVIQILEHGYHTDRSPYLVMELLEGCTLAESLRTRGSMSPAEALEILEPLVSALEATHAMSIIHRDIKASNVFLATAGEQRRVVLLDFGIAKLLDLGGPALTAAHQAIGTLACMSPEQIMNEPVDARTDVYGLGVLAFKMLVGELPFLSKQILVMQELHLHARPPLASSRGRVSAAFDDVILRAMSKSRDDRFPSVRAFLDAFNDALDASRSTPFDELGTTRWALAVYADMQVADEAPESSADDAERALDDFIPAIVTELETAGLAVVVETGASVLLCMDLSRNEAASGAARSRVVDAALTVYRRIDAQLADDRRIHVRLCFHTGELVRSPTGEPIGGSLLDVAGWLPEDDNGVFASVTVLAGLDVELETRVSDSGAHLRILNTPSDTAGSPRAPRRADVTTLRDVNRRE